MHVPKQAVANKMTQEGLDPAVLDMDPNEPAPRDNGADEDEGPRVAIKDDPRFTKFLTMLRMHVPKQAVANKMTQEGLDPAVLDMDPNEPAPRDKNSKDGKSSSRGKKEPPEKKYRRKRLHWNTIDKKRLQKGNNIWSTLTEEGTESVVIDDTEFDSLFVDKNVDANNAGKAGVETSNEKKNDKSKLSAIDGKRAMNCAIALARIKVPYDDIASSLRQLKGGNFTADQLISLCEFLPTDEEARNLKHFLSTNSNDTSRLGEADKFMLQMMNVERCGERFNCLALQKNYEVAEKSIREQVAVTERACDDVKKSSSLKKILSVVLKLGNKLNAGSSEVAAFSLDSLIKLKDAKAFDKKTTVMHFLVRLLERHDPDTLSFRKDLSNISDASTISSSSILTELVELETQLSAAKHVLGNEGATATCDETLSSAGGGGGGGDGDVSDMPYALFLRAATRRLLSLRAEVARVNEKYSGVLLYFGEDPELGSEDFFTTLGQFATTFDQAVVEVKELLRREAIQVRRQKEIEERKIRDETQQSVGTEEPGRQEATSQKDAKTLMLERARRMRNKINSDSSSDSEDGAFGDSL